MALAGCDISGSSEVCRQMYDNSFSGVLLHISYADLHHPHLHVGLVKFHFSNFGTRGTAAQSGPSRCSDAAA